MGACKRRVYGRDRARRIDRDERTETCIETMYSDEGHTDSDEQEKKRGEAPNKHGQSAEVT